MIQKHLEAKKAYAEVCRKIDSIQARIDKINTEMLRKAQERLQRQSEEKAKKRAALREAVRENTFTPVRGAIAKKKSEQSAARASALIAAARDA